MTTVLYCEEFVRQLGFRSLDVYTEFTVQYRKKARELRISLIPLETQMIEKADQILDDMKDEIKSLNNEETRDFYESTQKEEFLLRESDEIIEEIADDFKNEHENAKYDFVESLIHRLMSLDSFEKFSKKMIKFWKESEKM